MLTAAGKWLLVVRFDGPARMQLSNIEIMYAVLLVAILAALLMNTWLLWIGRAAARHALRQRSVLPLSTGNVVLPNQSAKITARPQRGWFKPERLWVSNAGTPKGAADWIINDIKVGGESQFSQSGDIPGDMFASNSIDSFVSFGTADMNSDVIVVVTYIGSNKDGAAFYASMTGEGPPDRRVIERSPNKRMRIGRSAHSVTA